MTDLSTIAMRATGTAFQILYEQRTPTTPVKKQRSGWQRVLAARAKAEGRNPDSAEAQTAKVLRVNPYSDVGRNSPSDRDRRNSTSGKHISTRRE